MRIRDWSSDVCSSDLKSTFIRAVSAATPKVADYPFTTLYPNLGVVSVEPGRSFVIADIPGLSEGAADGAGRGSLFLRHVQRTRLLLHLVDIAPMETGVEAEPVEQVRAIEAELRKYDPAMLDKPRWLILNKADLMFEDKARAKAEEIVAGLGWEQSWILVSAIGREGTWPIMREVMAFFHRPRADALEEAVAAGATAASAAASAAAPDAAQRHIPATLASCPLDTRKNTTDTRAFSPT